MSVRFSHYTLLQKGMQTPTAEEWFTLWRTGVAGGRCSRARAKDPKPTAVNHNGTTDTNGHTGNVFVRVVALCLIVRKNIRRYHQLTTVEQIRSYRDYHIGRTVYTIVWLTARTSAPHYHHSLITTSLCSVTPGGEHLIPI